MGMLADANAEALKIIRAFDRETFDASNINDAFDTRSLVTLASDASDSGVGWSRLDGPGGLLAEPLPADLVGSPSTTRELFGLCRALESSALVGVSAVRLLCDNTGAVATASGAASRVSTVRMARRLWRAANERGVTVYPEWVPRELLAAQDAASRWTDGSLAFAKLRISDYRQMWDIAWGSGGEPGLELFACEADRACPSVPFASRVPMPGSVGEALSLDWDGISRGWAYPPFGLVRRCLQRLVELHTVPDIVWLLPDGASLREALGPLGFRFAPGPTILSAPPLFDRPVRLPRGSTLVLCVPHPRRRGA